MGVLGEGGERQGWESQQNIFVAVHSEMLSSFSLDHGAKNGKDPLFIWRGALSRVSAGESRGAKGGTSGPGVR